MSHDDMEEPSDRTPLLIDGNAKIIPCRNRKSSSCNDPPCGGISSSSSAIVMPEPCISMDSNIYCIENHHENATSATNVHGESTATTPYMKRLHWIKTVFLTCLLILAAVFFTSQPEDSSITSIYSVSYDTPLTLSLMSESSALDAYYLIHITDYVPTQTNTTISINVSLYGLYDNTWYHINNDTWSVVLGPSSNRIQHTFDATGIQMDLEQLQFNITSNSLVSVPFEIKITGLPYASKFQVVYAIFILIGVYVLIVFELVHRMLAAMFGSFIALGVLSALKQRPSLDQIVEWIDFETVCLLFGMMIMVGIFAQTGFFEWAAVRAYKLSKGNIWRLVIILCSFTAVVSAFLDNVTTILLITPVTIRLCQVLNLDPRPVLVAEVLFSNIGGTATAVGDPPNVIIVSNFAISKAGIGFSEFTLHVLLAILWTIIGSYLLLKWMFLNIKLEVNQSLECAEIMREIQIWCRAANKLTQGSHEEMHIKELLTSKILTLRDVYDKKMAELSTENEKPDIVTLEAQYCIHDFPLFIKSCFVLGVVILMFFLHSIPQINLDLGWIALIGAIALIVIADFQNIEGLLEKVEWGTLLFFAALFILMEALAELGLISAIGEAVTSVIKTVPESSRLAVAILVILWVSALVSAFIDNIPFTTAMIPVIVSLSEDNSLQLPLRPLVWSLALGACLGGNGTLIGASANVVCAGLAEQNGCTISFNYFFKFGFPMMLMSVCMAMVYLIICHVAIGWN